MAGPQKDMPPAAYPVDPRTGRVAVVDRKTGKVHWLHPVDAKEQLSDQLKDGDGNHVDPKIRLATTVEAPPASPAPIVDWTKMPFEQLREHAQNAGVSFHARSRAQIENDLVAAGYVPPQEME